MMEHKAFSFDWIAFGRHLRPILYTALESDSTAGLIGFIDHHRASLTDPFEGEPLPEGWRSLLENGDVHEYGDFALTGYYSPQVDFGIGHAWLRLSHEVSNTGALLGTPFGPESNRFDPGRMGSYFQTPEDVADSLNALASQHYPEFATFVDLLERCGVENLGVYVTIRGSSP
jgi:hypothetical protein